MVFSIYFVHFSFNYKAALSRYWLASCSDRLEIIIRRNRSKWKEMKNNFLSKGCNIRCPAPPPVLAWEPDLVMNTQINP